MEEWKEIIAFPGYSVSSYGFVRNDNSGLILAMMVNRQGTVFVGMSRGQQYKRSVTLLVAQAFLLHPTLPHFDTPINLDGDKSNNHIENLAWRPRWFAMKYQMQFKNNRRGFSVPIVEIHTQEVFENSWEAATKYGLIDREILTATINRTYVWPTYQAFRVIDE